MLRVLVVRDGRRERLTFTAALLGILAQQGERFHRVVATARVWAARREKRQRLRELDAHLLNDIGITRKDWLSETSKPFWRD